ncbi:MAG: sugar O-acetyltransferase [Deltaproteobacteria bacterium]|jgi:galactoside O-acetyltransferase/maltose O-acetyltransferase|nr:sugar O-acetyltransferase [Deltaproteobacteria bacterium]
MSEKDKMLAGEPYLPDSGILPAERGRAKSLCQRHNLLPAEDMEGRRALIRELFGRTGERFHVEQPIRCDYGYNIEIGEDFYSNFNLVILDCARVTFGDFVKVGPGCGFFAVSHPLDPELRRTGIEFAKPITVGDDVWFGGGATVLPGVTIGRGSVIGAGSVVTRDVPERVVAVGNPCRVIGPAAGTGLKG